MSNLRDDMECRRAMFALLETFPDSAQYTERFLKDLEAADKRGVWTDFWQMFWRLLLIGLILFGGVYFPFVCLLLLL